MGNNNGIADAILNRGTNQTKGFNGGYFSFAFGNEIALIIGGGYYILNCDERLWDEVNKAVDEKTPEELINFWIDKSKQYEISSWSTNFESLKVNEDK